MSLRKEAALGEEYGVFRCIISMQGAIVHLRRTLFVVLNLVIHSHTIVKVSIWKEVLHLFYNLESNLSQLP